MKFLDLFRKLSGKEETYSLEKRLDARYAKNPFDRFCDAYVLWIIGELPAHLERKLQDIYTMPGFKESLKSKAETWQQAVEVIMIISPDVQRAVTVLWEKWKRKQEEHNAPPLPMEFATMFVDANFSDGD